MSKRFKFYDDFIYKNIYCDKKAKTSNQIKFYLSDNNKS